MFWYFVSTAVINNMLKIHDNIPHIKGVIATRVKHKCTGKIEVFITAGGGRWHCSRLSPVCPRAPVGSNQVWCLRDVGSLPRIAFPFVRPFIIGSSVDQWSHFGGYWFSAFTDKPMKRWWDWAQILQVNSLWDSPDLINFWSLTFCCFLSAQPFTGLWLVEQF